MAHGGKFWTGFMPITFQIKTDEFLNIANLFISLLLSSDHAYAVVGMKYCDN